MDKEGNEIVIPEPYGEELYQPENIIGYTGDLSKPETVTVYFKKGNLYGRITQVHDDPENIGREAILKSDYYWRFNSVKLDFCCCIPYHKIHKNHEFIGDDLIHISRTPFIKLNPRDKRTRAILAQSITRHKRLKLDFKPYIEKIKFFLSKGKSIENCANLVFDSFLYSDNTCFFFAVVLANTNYEYSLIQNKKETTEQDLSNLAIVDEANTGVLDKLKQDEEHFLQLLEQNPKLIKDVEQISCQPIPDISLKLPRTYPKYTVSDRITREKKP